MMNRYAFMGTPGGYQEYESDTGEWVRFSDVADIIRAYMFQHPEEYNSDYEILFTPEEIKDMSQSLRGVA